MVWWIEGADKQAVTVLRQVMDNEFQHHTYTPSYAKPKMNVAYIKGQTDNEHMEVGTPSFA